MLKVASFGGGKERSNSRLLDGGMRSLGRSLALATLQEAGSSEASEESGEDDSAREARLYGWAKESEAEGEAINGELIPIGKVFTELNGAFTVGVLGGEEQSSTLNRRIVGSSEMGVDDFGFLQAKSAFQMGTKRSQL